MYDYLQSKNIDMNLSPFKWSGLPYGCDALHLERTLLSKGFLTIFDLYVCGLYNS